MQRITRARVALIFLAATIPVAACGGRHKDENSAAGNVVPPSGMQPSTAPETASYGAGTAAADTTAKKPKHHSKIAGAAVGAAAGHMVGHPVAGAAAGAFVQHERNKHKK